MFNRTRINLINKWWFSIDRVILFLIIVTLAIGNIFTALASPVVANRIGINPHLFIIKNLIFSFIGLSIVLFFSTLNEEQIINISYICFVILIFVLIIVLFVGTQNKGARRWIRIFGFSLQPSEIIKPFFIITVSNILSRFKRTENLHIIVSLILYTILAILLVLQPDIGMLILISCVFFTSLFLVGIKLKYFIWLFVAFIITFTLLYFTFPHFHYRINSFVNSAFLGGETNYQVKKSISAFSSGGLLGKGPFEGAIKNHIPDAHTDFIFSVIGEEFGSIACIFIISIFFFISFRLMLKTTKETDLFKYISINCLSLIFVFQAIINIGVTLNLLPTKGMTLPLISYGGSSMIGISITLGLLLALTKQNYGKHYNLRSLIIGL